METVNKSNSPTLGFSLGKKGKKEGLDMKIEKFKNVLSNQMHVTPTAFLGKRLLNIKIIKEKV